MVRTPSFESGREIFSTNGGAPGRKVSIRAYQSIIWSIFLLLGLYHTIDGVDAVFVPVDDTNSNGGMMVVKLQGSSSTSSSCPFSYCQNGGICVANDYNENKDQENFQKNKALAEFDAWDCICPPGFAGAFCEIPFTPILSTSSLSSSSSSSIDHRRQLLKTTVCGDIECQNNGRCAEGHNYDVDGAVCDCTTAVEVLTEEDDGPPYDFNRWVGRNCEIQVTVNDFCEGNRYLFCVNNGTCRLEAEDFASHPCTCPEGFTGRHCEYSQEHLRSDCTLTCNGKGKCEHGIPPTGIEGVIGGAGVVTEQGKANSVLDLEGGAGAAHFMHCVCEEGYAGTNCDYEYMKCEGGRRQFCFHGSTCINGTDICECENENGLLLAGDYCQFEASDHCDNPVVISVDAARIQFNSSMKLSNEDPGESTDNLPFCVNRGVCYRVMDLDEYYCHCAPMPGAAVGSWQGKQCELEYTEPGTTLAPTEIGTETMPPAHSFDFDEYATENPTGPTAAPVEDTLAPVGETEKVQPCGELQCRNGGLCATGQNYDVEHALCDCTTAVELSDANNVIRYVGNTCETKVEEDDYCTFNRNTLFCVNGGACRNSEQDFQRYPCDCYNGYTGRHCEYPPAHVQDDCILKCSGNGQCQHGINPNTEKGANSLLNLENGGTQNFMHCVCDDGYAGTNCEYEATYCGRQRRYCFHGSTCIQQSDGAVCECTNVAGKKLIGDFCEYMATDHCDDPIEINATTASDLFPAFKKLEKEGIIPEFCVNDGICYTVPDTGDFYCHCDEAEWTGKRCEVTVIAPHETPRPSPSLSRTWAPSGTAPTEIPAVPAGPTKVLNAESKDDELTGGGKFGIVLVVFVGLGCMAFMFIYFRRRARWVKNMTYVDEDPHRGEDSVFRHKHIDTAPFEEDGALELAPTGSTSEGSTDSVNRQVPRPAEQTSEQPAHPHEEKNMSNVELV